VAWRGAARRGEALTRGVRSAALASELQGALSQISMYLKNILEHLSEAKYRRISMLNARWVSRAMR
jgi:hypothetical protein